MTSSRLVVESDSWDVLAQQRPFDLLRAEVASWLVRVEEAQSELLVAVSDIVAGGGTPQDRLLRIKRKGTFNVSLFEAISQLSHFWATLKATDVVYRQLAPQATSVHIQPTGTGLTAAEKLEWHEFDITVLRESDRVLTGEVSAASDSLKRLKSTKSKTKLVQAARKYGVHDFVLFFLKPDGDVEFERVPVR
jgi:hypothetical protein